MCHSTDSRPPAPPVVGPLNEQGRLDLTSAGYHAVPGEPNGASMVVMPDIRGLHPYYEALVARFAEAGFLTAGLDYFGRTAGIGARGGDFEGKQHLDQTTPEQIQADVGANGRPPTPAKRPAGLHGRLLLRRFAVLATGGQ